MKSIEDLLWEKAEPNIYLTREEYEERFLKGWDIKPVYVDGELAFVTTQKGPLFHFHSFGTKKPISLKMIRDFLQGIIDEHGFAETRTPHEDERQHRFNLRFGFQKVGADEFDTHFRIERLPMPKGANPCL